MKTRENNFDLLRIICMLGVILIHVSSFYAFSNNSTIYSTGNIISDNSFFICFCNMICRFAVPCFLMITGTFLLRDDRNKDFKYFYKKTFDKIVIPTIVFSLIYFAYKLICYLFVGEYYSISDILKDALKGNFYYHLWYMYMIIGVYLLIPIVIRLKDVISEGTFKKMAIVYFPFAIIALWTTTSKITYNLGLSFLYLSYVMIGYVISNSVKKKNNYFFWSLLLFGILIEVIMAFLVDYYISIGINPNDMAYSIFNNSPIGVIAYVSIFSAFSFLNIKKKFDIVPKLTFYVYLFHILVWELVKKIIFYFKSNDFLYKVNPKLTIPCCFLIVLLCSYMFAELYYTIVNTNLIKKKRQAFINWIFKEKVKEN